MSKAEYYDDEDDDIQVYKKHRHEGEEHMTDVVNHPPHYKDGGIETIDFIEAKKFNYNLGNVIKYLTRAGKKSECPIEDLKKAQWYLGREISNLEKNK
jgi:hypothetical protein